MQTARLPDSSWNRGHVGDVGLDVIQDSKLQQSEEVVSPSGIGSRHNGAELLQYTTACEKKLTGQYLIQFEEKSQLTLSAHLAPL